jgi:hypothetical protein
VQTALADHGLPSEGPGIWHRAALTYWRGKSAQFEAGATYADIEVFRTEHDENPNNGSVKWNAPPFPFSVPCGTLWKTEVR